MAVFSDTISIMMNRFVLSMLLILFGISVKSAAVNSEDPVLNDDEKVLVQHLPQIVLIANNTESPYIIVKREENISRYDAKILFQNPALLEKVVAEWLHIPYSKEDDYSLLWKILAVVSVLALFLFYRQYILHQYNQQLQAEVQRKVEELRKKDEILVRKLRMAAMGEMLSMIAHQWRQPLSAISNTLMSIDLQMKMGKYDLEDQRERESFLGFLEGKHNQINQYLAYLSHTIDDFKNFFKPDKKKELVSIVEPLERALALMGHSFEESGIRVETHYHTREKIEMVSNEIMQVILNMLKNSEYNFKEKKIETPHIGIYTEQEKDEVHIIVCDNGGGIPEENISKIFNPYYSTKDEINGTGLGLYMSKMMVEEHHGGLLSVKNTKEGVCFTLSFKTKKDQR